MMASKHENVRLKPAGGRLKTLKVRMLPGPGRSGVAFLFAGPLTIRCAVGRSGVTRRKREGDGATPVGCFRITRWLFRPQDAFPDRAGLHWSAIRRDHGWCDDPCSGAYNRPVRLPFPARHESLWREDGKYTAIGILDCNIRPRIKGGGSAIFFHLCDTDYGATAGCIAIPAHQFRKLLPRLSASTQIFVF